MFEKERQPSAQTLYFQPATCALIPLVPQCGSLECSMSHELEKVGRNQNDRNCPWQNSFRKRNGNLSPSRARCQATLPHASQVVSTRPASLQPYLAPCRLRRCLSDITIGIAAKLVLYKRYVAEHERTYTAPMANVVAQNYAHANVRFGVDLFTIQNGNENKEKRNDNE